MSLQAIKPIFRLSAFSPKAFTSLEKNFHIFLQRWFLNSFEIVVQPVLYFVAFGFGLQKWIGSIDGLAYPTYVLTGILMATAMSTSIYESAQGVYQRYFIGDLYLLLKTCPVRFEHMLFGEFLWSVFRATLAFSILLIIGSSLDLIAVTDFLPLIAICIWLCIFFASLGLLLTSLVKTYSQVYQYLPLIVIPQFLFCGVFFPIERLPETIAKICSVLPVSIAVDWARDGSFMDNPILSFSYVLLYLLFSFFMFNIASKRISEILERNSEVMK
ncbi:MAG: ABC transporter permease [Bdellovibrionota bacterium]|nr:ABC transporter permease [Bdellovibrionota bacterium]